MDRLTCLQMLSISSDKKHVSIMNWAIDLQPANDLQLPYQGLIILPIAYWPKTVVTVSKSLIYCAVPITWYVKFVEKNAVHHILSKCARWPLNWSKIPQLSSQVVLKNFSKDLKSSVRTYGKGCLLCAYDRSKLSSAASWWFGSNCLSRSEPCRSPLSCSVVMLSPRATGASLGFGSSSSCSEASSFKGTK